MTPEAAPSEVSNELQLLCKQTHIPTHAQTHHHEEDKEKYTSAEEYESTDVLCGAKAKKCGKGEV